MPDLAIILLRLRFVLGYPTWIVAGALLSIVVAGRLRRLQNGRRRLYRGLLMFCAGLVWSGVWGQMGVWQYGILFQALPIPKDVVSIGWGLGVLWLAGALGIIVWCVAKEELEFAQRQSPPRPPEQGPSILL